MTARVVVTGIGVVTAIGIGKEEYWNNVVAGKSGISEITFFDTSDFDNHRGGEIKNFDPLQFMSQSSATGMGRGSQLAVAAAKLAVKDAQLGTVDPSRMGVSFGTTMGDPNEFENINNLWIKEGEAAIGNFALTRYPPCLIPSFVAKELGYSGPNVMIPNACAAGNCAIGYAYDLIRSRQAEIMVAGGSDPLARIAWIGFNRLGAVSHDFPRPFDKNRKGMMLGEGSGVLILENLEEALKRKATIYAEILGYGLSCDAHHINIPEPRGRGIVMAMIRALRNSRLTRNEVDYINVHGTGTYNNDAAETAAIKKVFGRNPRVLVSSTKSMLGHTMGAASAIEAATCVLAVKNDIAPPTMNVREIDPSVTFDIVPNQAKPATINIAMNNGSAFGGNNASVIFKKYAG